MSDIEKIESARQSLLFNHYSCDPLNMGSQTTEYIRRCKVKAFTHGFDEGIAWRDANPNPKRSIEVQIKPIIDDVIEPWKEKIEELVKDRARYDWLIKNAGWYRFTDHNEEHTFMQIKLLPKADLSCRPMVIAAIDAAMKAKP